MMDTDFIDIYIEEATIEDGGEFKKLCNGFYTQVHKDITKDKGGLNKIREKTSIGKRIGASNSLFTFPYSLGSGSMSKQSVNSSVQSALSKAGFKKSNKKTLNKYLYYKQSKNNKYIYIVYGSENIGRSLMIQIKAYNNTDKNKAKVLKEETNFHNPFDDIVIK